MRQIDNDELFDIDLWMSYREGETAAFTTVYRRHAPAVLRYAWSIVGDQAAAEETLQETFLTAWDKRRTSHIVDESLLPWLLTICRNHARNQVRRIRKMASMPLDSITLPGRSLDDLSWIEAEISKLSRDDRILCQLCLVEGYSYSDAARVLETTQTAVGKRLQRVRARLAQSAIGRD